MIFVIFLRQVNFVVEMIILLTIALGVVASPSKTLRSPPREAPTWYDHPQCYVRWLAAPCHFYMYKIYLIILIFILKKKYSLSLHK